MKIIGIFFIVLCFWGVSYAECDWSNISQVDGGYLYPKDCHVEVGKLVKEASLREEQIKELDRAIELKDLALTKADERIYNWKNTTYELEDRIMKQAKWSSYNNWLYFGGGIIVTVLAGWAVGQASK